MTGSELKAWAEAHVNEMDGTGEYPTEEAELAAAVLALFAERDEARRWATERLEHWQAAEARLADRERDITALEDQVTEAAMQASALRARVEALKKAQRDYRRLETKLAEAERERDEAKAISLQMAEAGARGFREQRDDALARAEAAEAKLAEMERVFADAETLAATVLDKRVTAAEERRGAGEGAAGDHRPADRRELARQERGPERCQGGPRRPKLIP